MAFQLKRIYEPAAETDGRRVLVDRLWPRGVSKARAALDDWLKTVAPSTELREWFGHKPERFDRFKKEYRKELEADPDKQAAVQQLLDWEKQGLVTLLYAEKDPIHNNVVVLKALLDEKTGAAP